MNTFSTTLVFLFILCLLGCTNISQKESRSNELINNEEIHNKAALNLNDEFSNAEQVHYYADYDDESNSYFDDGESEDSYEDDNQYYFEDGTYTATVEYENDETGYQATYTLDVEVEDNQITIIYFPKGGWLDDDHIYPEELDDSGYAEVQGVSGKWYYVQLD